MKDYSKTLEIDNPLAHCGHCRFTTELSGKWTVEDGRLVFRAGEDPLSSRGPGLESCCESSPVVEFKHIEAGGEQLNGDQIAELRATARAAVERKMAEWAAEEKRTRET